MEILQNNYDKLYNVDLTDGIINMKELIKDFKEANLSLINDNDDNDNDNKTLLVENLH